ncbi:MAG: hypothetical protein HUJ65_01205 [Oscillospiraceae bacterium]|nr:hypothetical protein [Oscillospiraceae bacterium]
MRLFLTEKRDINEHEAVLALLSYAMREMYGLDLPRIERTEKGKPFFPDRPDIFFSLSHSKKHVLCAVGECPVGCDAEEPRTVTDRVIRRVCSEKELEGLGFFELWVLKESFIKLKGHQTMEARDICFFPGDNGLITPESDISARLYYSAEGVAVGMCALGECAESLEITDFRKVFSDY